MTARLIILLIDLHLLLVLFSCFLGLSSTVNPEPFIIFGNTVDIRRVNLDGTGYNYVVQGLTNVVGVDFDIKTKTIYWSDIALKKIQRVHIDLGLQPGNIEDFVVENVGIPEDLAVDWMRRKLFWTDASFKVIEVIHLNGTQRQVLISTGHDKPRAIALDPLNDKLYWTDWGSEPTIFRAKMSDGSQKEVLVNSGIVWPNGIALDYVTSTLFWADAKTDKIEKSDTDGQNRRVLIDRTAVYHPYALTQFGDHIYWTDWQRHSIEHCNKDRGNDRVTITGGMTRPTALHVYHPDRQPGAGKNNGIFIVDLVSILCSIRKLEYIPVQCTDGNTKIILICYPLGGVLLLQGSAVAFCSTPMLRRFSHDVLRLLLFSIHIFQIQMNA